MFPADFIALAKAGRLVNRPVNTELEWRCCDRTRPDVWIGGHHECTTTDERANVFYCSADTRKWGTELPVIANPHNRPLLCGY